MLLGFNSADARIQLGNTAAMRFASTLITALTHPPSKNPSTIAIDYMGIGKQVSVSINTSIFRLDNEEIT